MDPKLFGRYQIIRKLAGGGMGRVFLAYDPVLNRQVGLKLIDAGGDRDSIDVVAAERRRFSMWAIATGTSTSRWNTSKAKTSRSWLRGDRLTLSMPSGLRSMFS